MATLNQAMFDRSPFNIGQTNTVIWVNAEGNEYVDRMIGFSKEIYLYPVANEKVRKDIYVTKTIMSLSVEGKELIGYQTDLIGEFWLEISASEKISLNIRPTRFIYLDLEMVEKREKIFTSGREYRYPYSFNFSEELDFVHVPYFELWLDAESNELISQTSSVESTEETACMIHVTLHPGDILVVDANNYNVLLNGENAIDLHSGDWLDSLNRNTTAIAVQAVSGNSNLSASVMYTERYL